MYVIIGLFFMLLSLIIVIMYCALVNASDCENFENTLRNKDFCKKKKKE